MNKNYDMLPIKKRSDSVKAIVFGVLWIVAVCWFCYPTGRATLNELSLIRKAQIASGMLIETNEFEQADFRDHVYYSDVGVYSYRVPDGREFKTTTRVPTGELKPQQDVEYLPDNPAVSRIKGDGCQSLTEWIWRKVGVGSLLLALVLSPGVVLCRDGIRGMNPVWRSKFVPRLSGEYF